MARPPPHAPAATRARHHHRRRHNDTKLTLAGRELLEQHLSTDYHVTATVEGLAGNPPVAGAPPAAWARPPPRGPGQGLECFQTCGALPEVVGVAAVAADAAQPTLGASELLLVLGVALGVLLGVALGGLLKPFRAVRQAPAGPEASGYDMRANPAATESQAGALLRAQA